MNSECVLSSTAIVPVPLTMVGFVVGVVVGVAKCTNYGTSVSGFGVALFSVLMVLSCIVLLIAASFNSLVEKYSLALLASGLAIQIFVNAVSLILFRRLSKDTKFSRWKHSCMPAYSCSCLGFWTYSLAMFNGNFLQVVFSKGFGARVLSAPLSDPSKFRGLNFIFGLSMLPMILVLAGAVTVVARTRPTQLLMLCIDTIVLSTTTLILTALSLCKPANYFEEDLRYRSEVKSEVNLRSYINETQEDLERPTHEKEEKKIGYRPTRIENES